MRKTVVFTVPVSSKVIEEKDENVTEKESSTSCLYGIKELSIKTKIELVHKTSWGKIPMFSKAFEGGAYEESKPSCPAAFTVYVGLGIGIDPMEGKLNI